MDKDEPYVPKITPWDIPEVRVKISRVEQLKQMLERELRQDERKQDNDEPEAKS
jgi:hypothetical protein